MAYCLKAPGTLYEDTTTKRVPEESTTGNDCNAPSIMALKVQGCSLTISRFMKCMMAFG
jgi:hypothetical protein